METPEEQEEEEEEEGADKLVAVEGDAERDEGRTEVSEEALPTGTEEVDDGDALKWTADETSGDEEARGDTSGV